MNASEWLRLLTLLVMKCAASDVMQDAASKIENKAAEKLNSEVAKVGKLKVVNDIFQKELDKEEVSTQEGTQKSTENNESSPRPNPKSE
eukprot:11391493-Ditylum_brightwellii.AAC.1